MFLVGNCPRIWLNNILIIYDMFYTMVYGMQTTKKYTVQFREVIFIQAIFFRNKYVNE